MNTAESKTEYRTFNLVARSCVAVAAILTAGVLYSAETISPPTDSYAPEPKSPSRREMTEAAYQVADRKWREDHAKWVASLTPEQLFAKQKTDYEKYRFEAESNGRALRSRLPRSEDNYDWKQVALQKSLDAETIAQLEKEQLAYGPSVKQSFEPYLSGPVFITSDSLLNAYHVLFEDSFRELELRKAGLLRGQLERWLAAARKYVDGKILPQNRMEAALRHDQLVLGPAILLLGGSLDQFDSALREEISSQAEKIRQAATVELPAWLGSPDPESLLALDYQRCKPVGFYTDSEKLAGYFRAMRWLQMVPFRCARDTEFDAIILLREAYGRGNLAEEFSYTRTLIGPPDDLTVDDLRYLLFLRGPIDETEYVTKRAEGLITVARGLIENRRILIDSDMKLKSPVGTLTSKLSFRVFSAARTLDSVLFQRLIDQRRKPQGLAVAVMLGSTFAEKQLAGEDAEIAKRVRAESEIEIEGNELLWYSSIYSRYLNALSALFLPPSEGSPAFMKSEAWSAKSCQTALSGWAQFRHSFTLQAKLNANFKGLVSVPPGFVEDNPEFFARMARLIDRSHDLWRENGCFEPRALEESEKPKANAPMDVFEGEPLSLQQRWLLLGRLARSLEAMSHKQLRRQSWTVAEEYFLRGYGAKLANVMGYDGNSWLSPKDDAPRWVEVSRDTDVRSSVSLAAAIGRPRFFYVLYPWNGMQILCKGSVMQYYEYQSAKTLTDIEWKTLLDSDDSPPLPAWLGAQVKTPGKPVKINHLRP